MTFEAAGWVKRTQRFDKLKRRILCLPYRLLVSLAMRSAFISYSATPPCSYTASSAKSGSRDSVAVPQGGTGTHPAHAALGVRRAPPHEDGGGPPLPLPNPPLKFGAKSPGAPPSLPSPASLRLYPPSRSPRSPLGAPRPPGRRSSAPIMPLGGAWVRCCLMCVAGTISAGRCSHSRR